MSVICYKKLGMGLHEAPFAWLPLLLSCICSLLWEYLLTSKWLEFSSPPPESLKLSIVLSQVLNNNLVSDCIRSNLWGSKFFWEGMPLTPLVGTLLSSCLSLPPTKFLYETLHTICHLRSGCNYTTIYPPILLPFWNLWQHRHQFYYLVLCCQPLHGRVWPRETMAIVDNSVYIYSSDEYIKIHRMYMYFTI